MATDREADALLRFTIEAKKQTGTICPVCALPERELIDTAKRKAKRGQCGGEMVRRYLIAEKGYTDKTAPKKHAIERHFISGHHRREPQ